MNVYVFNCAGDSQSLGEELAAAALSFEGVWKNVSLAWVEN